MGVLTLVRPYHPLIQGDDVGLILIILYSWRDFSLSLCAVYVRRTVSHRPGIGSGTVWETTLYNRRVASYLLGRTSSPSLYLYFPSASKKPDAQS